MTQSLSQSLSQLFRPVLTLRWASVTALSTVLLASCSSLPGVYESQLADHLSQTGAKMYGAYWCPHCANQKHQFGGAASRLPYVECDPEGINSRVDLCQEAGIDVYPTWIIEGEYYFGVQPLGRLSVLSGFEEESPSTADFENEVPAGGYSSAE